MLTIFKIQQEFCKNQILLSVTFFGTFVNKKAITYNEQNFSKRHFVIVICLTVYLS